MRRLIIAMMALLRQVMKKKKVGLGAEDRKREGGRDIAEKDGEQEEYPLEITISLK